MVGERLKVLTPQVIDLYLKGTSKAEMARVLKISRNSVNAILAEAKEQGKLDNDNNKKPDPSSEQASQKETSESKQPPAGNTRPNAETPDKKRKIIDDEEPEEPEPLQEKIMEGAEKGFIKLAGSSLARNLLDDLKDNLETAQRIKKYELLYRTDIEELGFNWFDFVDIAFQNTYRQVIAKMKEQAQAESQETDILKTQIKQRLISEDLGVNIGR